MRVSIEVPVFKGRFLQECIDSVLAQTSEAWTLSLVWDGGDELSRRLLQALEQRRHPRIRVYFTENRGIACARKFLSDRSDEAYILPLDDDDLLAPRAVERFLQAAREYPWASLIRARRELVQQDGQGAQQDPWFPFGPRHYQRGMVTDVFNQAQPYLIRRSAYASTCGWRGFADFLGAGEDCDIFLQLEELAHFELVDEVLYRYRLHETRASHSLTPPAAFEMWRRLADQAIARMGLPLARASERPPFVYRRVAPAAATLDDVEFVLRADSCAAAALQRCGVAESALLRVPASVSGRDWKMTGFRAARRPLVCFLEDDVCFPERSALEALLRALSEADADLLSAPAPGECLLLRREVIAATGGFDASHVAPSLQNADLWLQACRRDFRCVRAPLAGASSSARQGLAATLAELSQLRAKWRTHPALLDSAGLGS
ncbi:MAG TPA: glycosyltransferase family 2 protein [Polyangiaceae bacterium]|nr:glycosyltransferase family 2 protein [Polyangiaceae bacterium]